MADAKPVLLNFRGGRNGADPIYGLLPTQCLEAYNVDFYGAALGRKRGGSASVSLSGAVGLFLNGPLNFLFRNVPGNAETAAELWTIDSAAPNLVAALAAGTTWQNCGLDDPILSRPMDANGCAFNGKLFLAYTSGFDRLHVHEGGIGIFGNIRRVGLAPATAAPTAANLGSGGYPNVPRYYRVRFLRMPFAGTSITARSEPSPASAAFTPSGSGSGVIITRPALPAGEPATHWELEGSLDNVTWYLLFGFGVPTFSGVAGTGPIAIGTTVAGDGIVTTIYGQFPLSDPIGMYVVPTGVKYVMTDDNRLLMAGATQPGKNNRVWWTPVLDSDNAGDDERIPTTLASYTDLEENAGDSITGFGGPLFVGVIVVFMYRRVWQLTPTGDDTVPYLQRKLTDSIGAIGQKAIDLGEDEAGQPCLYFLDPHKGPYRMGTAGFQYIGHDVEDIWKGPTGPNPQTAYLGVNLEATSIAGLVKWYPDIHQVWFLIATGTNNDPDTVLVFDPQLGQVQANGEVRMGWSLHVMPTPVRCLELFSNTIGASMSLDLKPYVGLATGTTLWKRDTSDTTDAGTPFQAFVSSGSVLPGSALGTNLGVAESILVARPLTGATITQTLTRDFGLETQTSTVSLTPAGSEACVIEKFEGSAMAQAGAVQITLGDARAIASGQWSLQALMVPLDNEGDR